MVYKNLGQRLLVAGIGGPLVVAAAWFGGYFFFALVVGITLLASHEFLAMLKAKGSAPLKGWLYLAAVVVLWLAFRQQFQWITPATIVFLLGLLIFELFRSPNNALLNTAGGLLAYFYLAMLYAFMLAVRELPARADLPYRAGGEWILLILFSIWVCDTAAYFTGSRFGKHKLAPQISPNKTIEGALGGLAGGMLTAVLCQWAFAGSLRPGQALAIGAIVGVFGQMSDLVESQFKRDAGVKDTSSLLPGHGGILDRFDSQLLAVPVIYLYLNLILL